jgi:hypothetical protein
MIRLFMRTDYTSGACTHQEYYAQFVTPYIKEQLALRMKLPKILNSKCKHFNDVPLWQWDRCALIASVADKKLDACEDFPTHAGRVCILKEAARQLREAAPDA